jgi:DNA-directed RNA polymerase specialized sigma24 family protein
VPERIIQGLEKVMAELARKYEAKALPTGMDRDDLFQEMALAVIRKPDKKWDKLELRSAMIDSIRDQGFVPYVAYKNGARAAVCELKEELLHDKAFHLTMDIDIDARKIKEEVLRWRNGRIKTVMLLYLQDMTGAEIGRKARCREETACRLLAKGREKLKRKFGDTHHGSSA